MQTYVNTNLSPLDVSDYPWLYEYMNSDAGVDIGKWMLFYDKTLINDAWMRSGQLFRDSKLLSVRSMKCSTNYENPRASNLNEGVIIFYCSNSTDEESILKTGTTILNMLDYDTKPFIFYKTDLQTHEGTAATGKKKNHTYKLVNPLYRYKKLKIHQKLLF
jgi:hypothetical protein